MSPRASGLSLSVYEIFLSPEVWLEVAQRHEVVFQRLQRVAVATFLGLLDLAGQRIVLLVVDVLLAFEQLQTHVGCTQVTTHADDIGLVGPVTIHDVRGFGLD